MGYRNMTLDKLIQTIIQATNSSNSKNFCFFLGSGASKTSGIRTGRELVEEWDKEIRGWGEEDYRSWCKEKGITPENRTSFYSAYYDKRYGLEEDEGYDFIERTMEAGRPNAGYMMLAQILTQTPHRVVITTNFDHLTETAVDRYTDRMPLVIGHEHLAKFVKAPATRPTIIKIHRDMLLEPISESDGLQELAQVWKDALEKLFKEYHPVFLGYSGGDKNVMEFLQENAGRFNNKDLKMPYWTFYGKDFSSAEVKAFMDKVQGFCIFECDFDAFMVRLADAFGLDFPDVEKILEDEKADCEKAKAKVEEIRKSVKRAEAKKLVDKADGLDWDDEKQRKEMEGLLCDAIRLDPNDAVAHRLLGNVLYGLGRKTEVEAELREAIRLNPNDVTAHYNLGNVLDDLGRKTEAEAEYREAIRLAPNYARVHNNLGYVLSSTGRKTEAEAEYREAIRLDPNYTNAHNGLGVVLYDLGRKIEAEVELREAIRLAPNYACVHNNLGYVLSSTGRKTEAEAECREAVRLDPNYAVPHFNLGVVLNDLGRKTEAEAEYREAIRLDPNNAAVHIYLALLLDSQGRKKEAAAERKIAASLRKNQG